MKAITAKFNSKCAATGQAIKKGENIIYDQTTKRAYKLGNEPKNQYSDDANIVQAQEDAYFDNFCQNNGI